MNMNEVLQKLRDGAFLYSPSINKGVYASANNTIIFINCDAFKYKTYYDLKGQNEIDFDKVTDWEVMDQRKFFNEEFTSSYVDHIPLPNTIESAIDTMLEMVKDINLSVFNHDYNIKDNLEKTPELAAEISLMGRSQSHLSDVYNALLRLKLSMGIEITEKDKVL